MQGLIDLVRDKNIAIFGTGTSAARLNKILIGLGISIQKFVDNKPKKWGEEFFAKKIIGPSSLCLDTDFIIIASMYEKEIGEQLLQIGFTEECNFIYGRKIIYMDGEFYYTNSNKQKFLSNVKGFRTIQEYNIFSPNKLKINYFDIKKDVISMKSPKILSTNQIPSFMFPHQKTPTGLVEYIRMKNGISYDYNGAIVDSEGFLLYEYSTYNTLNTNVWDAQKIKIYAFDNFTPNIINVNGKVGVVTTIWGQDNYYHWMFEELPRFYLLQQTGVEIDYYLSNYAMTKFQIDTLKSIGIDTNKIISSSENYAIQADELVIPYAPAFDSGYVPRWICDFIRSIHIEKAKDIKTNAPRIYIARGNVTHKKVINEEALLPILEDNGFKICYMEKYSQEEQAALFYHAEVIVAPHGAGLSNLVYCQEGTKVLEIFNPAYVPVMFWCICSQMNLDYYCSLGNRTEIKYTDFIEEKLNVKDISVNLEEICDFLNIINGGPNFEI